MRLKYGQSPKHDGTCLVRGPAPVAKMQPSPANTQTPPTMVELLSVPKRTTPLSQSSWTPNGAWATDGRSSTESQNSAKGNTYDDDDTTDNEYTPRKRHKRRKDKSYDSSKLSTVKSRPARHTPTPEQDDRHTLAARKIGSGFVTVSPRPRKAPASLFVTQENMGAFAQSPLSQTYVSADQVPDDDLDYIGPLESNGQKQSSQDDETTEDDTVEDSRPPEPAPTSDPERRRPSLSPPALRGRSIRPLPYSRPGAVDKARADMPIARLAMSEDRSELTRDAQSIRAHDTVPMTRDAQVTVPAPRALEPAPSMREVRATPTPPPAPAANAMPTPTAEFDTALPSRVIRETSPEKSPTHPKLGSQIQLQPEVRYFVITSRSPRVIKHRWSIESLSSKSLKTIFKEVAMFKPKSNIQEINFKLETSRGGESNYMIRQDASRIFDEMIDDFANDIMNDIEMTGNTTFRIWLEPDPGKDEAGETSEAKASFAGDNRRIVFGIAPR